jgi:hypothetical protein
LTFAHADANLYVGTSASELLHFVQIPPDPNDRSGQPVYILASRLCPQYVETPGTPNSRPGVQQILLLPRVGKACILCNWTVTFYSLPELSPVFGTTLVKNCSWIGGTDLNEPLLDAGSAERGGGVTILLSLMRKIQVVRVGEDARAFKVRVSAWSDCPPLTQYRKSTSLEAPSQSVGTQSLVSRTLSRMRLLMWNNSSRSP